MFKIGQKQKDQTVYVGQTMNLFCQSENTNGNSSGDWKFCNWTRNSIDSWTRNTCHYEYHRNHTEVNSWWIHKKLCLGLLENSSFFGSDTFKYGNGNNKCGIMVVVDWDDAGNWTCSLEQCKNDSGIGCTDTTGVTAHATINVQVITFKYEYVQ